MESNYGVFSQPFASASHLCQAPVACRNPGRAIRARQVESVRCLAPGQSYWVMLHMLCCQPLVCSCLAQDVITAEPCT